MGILTLLRNAFGRSRKGRSAEGEPSRETTTTAETAPASAVLTEAPASAEVPAQSTGPDDEHELVSAAFDNVTVPRQATPKEASANTTTAKPAAGQKPEPTATTKPEPEPEAEEKPEPEAAADPEPVAEETPEAAAEETPEPEATADPEPVAEAEAEPVATADPEPVAEETPEAAAEETPEPEAAAEPEPVAEAEAEPVAAAEPEPVAEETTEPEATEAEPTAEKESEPEVAAEPEREPAAEVTAETAETAEPEAAAEPEPAVEAEPEATPEPEAPEPEAEAVAEVTPEAEPTVTAPEPEATQEPEPEPAPVAEATPEPVAEATPEPQAEAETETEQPEPAAETTPEAEPEAKDPEPVAPAEPVAAAEEAPIEPSAPADTEAEAEAEATPATETDVDTDTEADAKPALTPTEVKSHAPGLTTAYKAAATVLDKHGLAGTRAKVYLVLDRSASMRPYYKDGSAQALGEQALALAAHLDPEAAVHVVFFSTELDGTGELTLAEHENKVDDLHAGLGRMGRTSYHAAVEAVTGHHDKSADPALPALVIFQTDGAPDAKTPATQALTDAAKSHPALFFSFIAFGDPENKAFDYLRKLKSDNTAHFLAGETPRELTDTEVYEGILANWRP
ncbi:VWA domain-containing protein [Streptomyces sp. NPDC002573]|uniref:VWA domain-containing protein n=1 Tax=Streptomyces sp. NPDC002573 TaxID=3364651 RepID=UPI003697908B